jgi:4-nitrophenyl phosphatase
VEATTGARPKVIGKPNAEIINVATEKLQLKPEQIAVVGDRLYTDIASGVNAGMLSILVMSGETDEDMLAQSNIKPDLVFKDLGAIQERMMELGI